MEYLLCWGVPVLASVPTLALPLVFLQLVVSLEHHHMDYRLEKKIEFGVVISHRGGVIQK